MNYTIENSISLYEDYGQFYWKLQGDQWDFEVGSFKALLTWESVIPKDNYRIWAHGPLWGDFTKTDEFSANLRIEELPRKTFVETRILLPTSYFTMTPNQTGKILETVVTEETKGADESNAEREAAKTQLKNQNKQSKKMVDVKKYLNYIIFFAGFIVLCFCIFLFKKSKN